MLWFMLSLAIAGTEPTSTEDAAKQGPVEAPAPTADIPSAPALTNVPAFAGSVTAFDAMPAPLPGLPPLVGLPTAVPQLPVVGLPTPTPTVQPLKGLRQLVPGVKDISIPLDELSLDNIIEDQATTAKGE
jgi:hypothetical protein